MMREITKARIADFMIDQVLPFGLGCLGVAAGFAVGAFGFRMGYQACIKDGTAIKNLIESSADCDDVDVVNF